MTDIPFIVLLANTLLLLTGLFTATIWCPFMIRITEWHKEPRMFAKASILLVGLFIPLAVCWGFVVLFLPQALRPYGGG